MKQLRLTFLASCSLCLISCGQANSEASSSITAEIAEPVTADDAVAGKSSASSDENEELLIPVTETSQDKVPGGFPENFHGEFRSSSSACGSDADDSVLVVSNDQLLFWESAATPQSIIRKGPNELLVSLLNEGEGETWNTQISIILSQNGDVLTVREDDFSFDRFRCPVG